ncbi:SPOR domain-containing protein [Adhaeribacter terreus]|uniref:SPOR domain-containing protein n=1 Tax=Adhaeribacter terreus TaxID=529703 RepID=A0ABW0E721_9BACT
MVLKQIQDLLHDHDCVIIPDFGGLIAQYASAKIHPVKHTFTPPSKKIAFNEKLQHNDGLLISNLAQHLRVSAPEAQQMVAQFVGNIQSELAQNKRFELQGIGIFRYNAEQKLEFEYLEAENYYAHSFGLPELVARPVIAEEAAALRAVRQKVTPKPVPAGKKGLSAFARKYGTVAATVLTGGLTVAMVYYVSLNSEYNLSSLNPVALFQQKTQTQAPETVAFSEEKVAEAFTQQLETLPVTPEEESVAALEADYDNTVSNIEAVAAPEPVALKPLPTRQVNLNEKAENAMETAAKTAEPKAEIKTAVAKNEIKAEPKAAIAKAEVKTVSKPAEKVVTKAEAKINSETAAIKKATGRYFIISGGFSSLENAERSKKQLAAKGAEQAEVMLPNGMSKLHRVSVAEFDNMETAAAKLPELRKKYGNALWILNY